MLSLSDYLDSKQTLAFPFVRGRSLPLSYDLGASVLRRTLVFPLPSGLDCPSEHAGAAQRTP